MSTRTLTIIGFVVAVLLVAAYSSLVVVSQTQQALVLQFGALQRVVTEPGLTIVFPWQNIRIFDNRILPLESDAEEVITSEKKRIVVDAFARFRIVDPVKFFQAASTEEAARQRLTSLMNSSLRGVLGRQNLGALLSGERESLMRAIRDMMQPGAAELGIRVVDVRIRRADLPQKNQESVYQRMQAERKQEAEKNRAEGDEEAQRITSTADKEATVIRAQATQRSDILRGEGEAERNRVLGEAFGRDPEFFGFYRSLKAYEQSMDGSNTTMVITPDSPFFKYFKNGQSGAR